MPTDMNSDPGGQSLGSMSYAKSTSDSTQEDNAGGAGQMRQQGSAGMDQVKSGASKLTGKARKQVSRYVEGYKGTVTQQIDTVAQAIRQAGEELGHNDQSQASRLADQAAGGLESLSRTIQDADVEDVLNAVRRFGRSNPTIFVGGAVLAGMALARFARASSRSQHQSQGGGSWQSGGSDQGQWAGRPDAQRSGQASYSGSPYGSAGSGGSGSAGGAGSFRTGGAATYGTSGSSGGGGLGTAAAAAGGAGGFGSGSGGFGSAAGGTGGGQGLTRSGTGVSGAPGSAQGYAGGGMGTDPIQSSAGSGQTSTPSSATDPSVGGSSTTGGMSSGAISTGENS